MVRGWLAAEAVRAPFSAFTMAEEVTVAPVRASTSSLPSGAAVMAVRMPAPAFSSVTFVRRRGRDFPTN